MVVQTDVVVVGKSKAFSERSTAGRVSVMGFSV